MEKVAMWWTARSISAGVGLNGKPRRAAIGPCEPSDAMATPAYDLDPPVRHVIHTVGLVWEGGGYGEA